MTAAAAHPALAAKSLAVITGGASGIGLAAAQAFSSRYGMSVAIGDRVSDDKIAHAVKSVQSGAKDGAKAWGGHVDVADRKSVETFAQNVKEAFPDLPVTVLMANAGVSGASKASEWGDGWEKVLHVNMFGVINTVQTLLPMVKAHNKPALVINTGSKQGITTPPGTGPAYNISKAAVKVYTEQLAHEMRADASTKHISPRLMVPGWVFTNIGGALDRGDKKPEGAWSSEQTVDYMIENINKGVSGVRGRGVFILVLFNSTHPFYFAPCSHSTLFAPTTRLPSKMISSACNGTLTM